MIIRQCSIVGRVGVNNKARMKKEGVLSQDVWKLSIWKQRVDGKVRATTSWFVQRMNMATKAVAKNLKPLKLVEWGWLLISRIYGPCAK